MSDITRFYRLEFLTTCENNYVPEAKRTETPGIPEIVFDASLRAVAPAS